MGAAKTLLAGFAAGGVALAAYLALWPVPIEPLAWSPAGQAAYSGVHAPNQRLVALQHIPLNGEVGPEHIAFGPDGKLYTTVASGNVLRMNGDGSGSQVFVNTGGRVLGFDFDAKGNLIAADAFKGLLKIAPDASITLLTDKVAPDDPIVYADAVVVARNGKMYLSDASTRFAPKDWGGTFPASFLDILEQSASGRILEFDPASGKTRLVARGLSFANGVALSEDQHWLFVNETGRYRVWKIAVDADRADLAGAVPSPAVASVLLDNLPGYPDNLMRGRDGRIWLGFTKPRSAVIDALAGKPWLRKLMLRLPRATWPVPKTYGHVIAFTEDGKIVADLQDPSGSYPETTAITETAERLYVQSLHATTLAWLPRSVLTATP